MTPLNPYKPLILPALAASFSVLFASEAFAITPVHVSPNGSTVVLAIVLEFSLGFVVRERIVPDDVARKPRFYIARCEQYICLWFR